MQGWIKLHRKILTNDIFQNEKMLKVFIYCLVKTTHKDRKQRIGRQVVELKPGQFVFGRKKAAVELNMAESTLWDYMIMLKEDKVISIKSNNRFSVVTVDNWGFYQSEEEKSDNKPTTDGQQMDTNKNVKNVKKKDYTSKMKELLTVFSSIENFNQINKEYWNIIRETRKTGKIAKSVIYNTMEKWRRFDLIVVEYALKTHIEAHAGKREEYTIGIMRKTDKDEAEDRLNRIDGNKSNVIGFQKSKDQIEHEKMLKEAGYFD